MKKFTSVKTP